jgi:hypothetical protein
MHMQYFGDSYDIVKQSLIRWLGRFGDWSVHPMLTESATAQQVERFEWFLGARVLSAEVLTTSTNRESYLSCGTKCGNLFLDPDTGFRSRERGARAPRTKYLFAHEFTRLSEQRPRALTLSLTKAFLEEKSAIIWSVSSRGLQANGIHCFAYMSHACFILGSRDGALVRQAFDCVVTESRLPEARFLSGRAATSESDC